jgi:CheY-like chemotaxis protein
VVLMDVQMPEVDGLEATRQLRAQEARSGQPPTPVIALTASVLSQDRKDAEAAGMNGFAVKPLDMASLRRKLPASPACPARWPRSAAPAGGAHRLGRRTGALGRA